MFLLYFYQLLLLEYLRSIILTTLYLALCYCTIQVLLREGLKMENITVSYFKTCLIIVGFNVILEYICWVLDENCADDD